MTREEAIKIACGISGTKAQHEALEFLIPELVESEDERIIKTLQEYVKNRNWMLNGPTQDEVLAWLEKRKENPKSADSIPSDCVSDAKCEDRWHKVGDSLPDNPREVLCKDEVGNYFIGRYYVGEGWDISNYDDEDKPHHLNPPVSKWVDFPSEKQKEQKPVPKFSVGDYVIDTNYKGEPLYQIVGIDKECYICEYRGDKGMGDRTVMHFAFNNPYLRLEQKPADRFEEARGKYQVEWNEEDELNCNRIIRFLEPHKTFFPTKETKKEMQNWIKKRIKSLSPSWKPCKGQMEMLRKAINCYESDWGKNKLLRSLINDLEKQM